MMTEQQPQGEPKLDLAIIGLKQSQLDVLNALAMFMRSYGASPTQQRIADILRVSRAAVHIQVSILRKKQLVTRKGPLALTRRGKLYLESREVA